MIKFKKIYIEITNICNFNCSFCSKDNILKKEMTIDEFEYIINQIKPYTNYIYLHVKGEPLYHSKFKEIIDICDKYNIKVNITTNGSLIKKQIEVLKNKCIRQINISLQTYKNINDEFLDIVTSLSNDKNIVYRFWALDNYILKDKYVYNYILNYYNCKDLGNNIKLKNNIYIQKNKLFDWPNIDNMENSHGYCLGTISHIGILSNGTVIPCCLDSSGIVNLGNIFDTPLHEILASDKYQNMRNSFMNNRCSEELCLHCTYKNNFKN